MKTAEIKKRKIFFVKEMDSSEELDFSKQKTLTAKAVTELLTTKKTVKSRVSKV